MSTDGLFDLADVRPPYWVRSMKDRESIPRNGLIGVGTFSGSGGSSLGLKTAGFTIPYALEFTPQGAATYQANNPAAFVDERDIRDVQAEDILDHLGMVPGQLDLFEGSPPCSSFSAAGVRGGQFEDKIGKVKDYSEGIKQRTDDLFEQWVRLVDGLRPRAILAENVPDMAKVGPAADYLHMIAGMLTNLDYDLSITVQSALSVGCATRRRRLVIVGVRKDVGVVPRPKLMGYGYTLREALDMLPVPIPADELAHSWCDERNPTGQAYAAGKHWLCIRPGESHGLDNCQFPLDERREAFSLVRSAWDRPIGTATATGAATGTYNIMHPDVPRKFTATELGWISGFPADYILTGSPENRYERIGRAVVPPLYEAIGKLIAKAISCAG